MVSTFVLVITFQHPIATRDRRLIDGFNQWRTSTEVTRTYTTKQGLMQAAHYWARYHQFDSEDLWRGGYYSNYVLFLTNLSRRVVMHAYQTNATKNFQSLAINLDSIALRSGLGEDVRGEAYKVASSSKGAK